MLVAGGALAQEPSVRASVDRAEVGENESFTYSIRAEGRVRGEPDASLLEQDFDVLTRTSNTSIHFINGQTQQVAEWQFQLMPKRTGRFTLPAIDVGGTLSNQVELEVLPAVASADEPADIFIEIDAVPAEPYVQSQVIYTLKLFVGVSTGRATLTAPQITGGEAIVERLGEDNQYQTVRAGRSFIVRERRYAIFPQETGPLTIGPATFEAMVIPNRGFSRVQRLRSDSLQLNVQGAVAPPPELASATWLPARGLRLREVWADQEQSFSLGVPRTRTLIVEADGILETQLPELTLEPIEGIRQYPDQPELEREITELGIQGRRIERYAVIAQQSGDLSLEGVELPWWNIEEARWEVARIEPRTVNVLPGVEPIEAPDLVMNQTPVAAPVETRPNYWPLLSAVLALGWATTLGFVFRGRLRARAHKPRRVVPIPRRATHRQLLRQLRAACGVHDSAAAHRLLLEWAALRFPDDPPTSLGMLADKLPDDLAAAVAGLEGHLYGRSADGWRGDGLAASLAKIDSVSQTQARGDKDPLLPLYR